jgi:hypothetical protein
VRYDGRAELELGVKGMVLGRFNGLDLVMPDFNFFNYPQSDVTRISRSAGNANDAVLLLICYA